MTLTGDEPRRDLEEWFEKVLREGRDQEAKDMMAWVSETRKPAYREIWRKVKEEKKSEKTK
jgi:predicted Rossmann-fold nucleotide-binding protein